MIKHILKLIWNKRGSNALMILEIFLSFLVLFAVVAYIMFNMERRITPLGFATEDKWMVKLDGFNGLDSLEVVSRMESLKRDLLDQPEIEAVSFGKWAVPFSGSMSNNGTDKNGFKMRAIMIDADTDLEKTSDLNVIEGRWFTEEDLNSTIPCVVVNSKFMELYSPDKSMIDSTFLFDDPYKIVGVIDHYRYLGQFEEERVRFFI